MIEIYPVEEGSSARLCGLVSSNGRSILCGEETELLGAKGWISFAEHVRQYKRCRWLKIYPYLINRINNYGRDERGQEWVDAFVASLVELSRRSPHMGERGTITIPSYLGKLNEASLNRFLGALFNAFSKSKRTAFIRRIDYESQQRLFSLFTRTGSYKTTSRGKSRIYEVGIPGANLHKRPDENTNNRGGWWPSPNLLIRTSNIDDSVVTCCINRYRIVDRDIYETLVEVRTQIGNFIDKSFICRTEKINPA